MPTSIQKSANRDHRYLYEADMLIHEVLSKVRNYRKDEAGTFFKFEKGLNG